MNFKKTLYLASYLIPGRPTLALINEYSKLKEKRNPFILTAGYIGTFTLAAKIILVTTGIFALNKNFERKEKSLEQKVDSIRNLPTANLKKYKTYNLAKDL